MAEYQKPLPKIYKDLKTPDLIDRVNKAKKTLGDELVLLAHHYQRPEIVEISDMRGDSLKLAQYSANQKKSIFTVFCGVYFMAETADILKQKESQTIILPDLGAGCDLADAATIDDVVFAWDSLVETLGHESIMPITYINSTASLKSFVGQKEGTVCTSSNAKKIIQWALDNKKVLFFFPDQHLGRNTCKQLGINKSKMAVWDPKKELGGLTKEECQNAQVFLWKGHCPVHMMFTSKQIDNLLEKDPSFKIIAHPECGEDVVEKSHYSGSTEFIVNTIKDSPSGSKWAVGTELNLVNRIAKENPNKKVVSINPFMCLCGTMNRIDLPHLAWSLDCIVEKNPQNIIKVEEPERIYAKDALERMLKLSQSL